VGPAAFYSCYDFGFMMTDGPGWSLEIQHADRKLDSGGYCAYPGPGGKPVQSPGEGRPDHPFPRLLQAASRLT
jgi:hypothetical protein